jgi:uncharacterized tellurite resistance protein B-like protein
MKTGFSVFSSLKRFTMVIHSTFPDFILFLYVHIAHTDDSYDPKEMSMIKSKMTKLFPPGTDLEKKLYQTIREYNSFDKSRITDLFRDTFAYFRTDSETRKSKLFADVTAIIEADGKVLPTEQEALFTIKRIIDFA